MTAPVSDRFVTPQPWKAALRHPRYATDETYRRGAAWLADCQAVADWGGGTGYFRRFLRPEVHYTLVDGTVQGEPQVLADLASYHEPCEGIVLRHVLDNTPSWRAVLDNALAAYQHRLVIVTFTPEADRTHQTRLKSGWPITRFAVAELRAVMGPQLVADESVHTSHPERLYYLQRAYEGVRDGH